MNASTPLPPQGWEPRVHRQLCQAIAGAPDGSVAVFDFDNTCIFGDVGELFGHYLIEEMAYRYDLDAFWALIGDRDNHQTLRSLTAKARAIGDDERRQDPVYRRYVAEMASLYGRRLQRLGKRHCYEWAVRLHVGLSPEQMRRYSRAALARELAHDRVEQTFRCDDGFVATVARGIRPIRQIQELVQALQTAGVGVWIVSASNFWTVAQAAHLVGVPPSQVIGNRVHVHDGRLSDRLRAPALFREGKVATIDQVIGHRPWLVAGDAITDLEMLCVAEEVALVIDSGDPRLRKEARLRDWLVQPQQDLTAAISAPPEETQ